MPLRDPHPKYNGKKPLSKTDIFIIEDMSLVCEPDQEAYAMYSHMTKEGEFGKLQAATTMPPSSADVEDDPSDLEKLQRQAEVQKQRRRVQGLDANVHAPNRHRPLKSLPSSVSPTKTSSSGYSGYDSFDRDKLRCQARDQEQRTETIQVLGANVHAPSPRRPLKSSLSLTTTPAPGLPLTRPPYLYGYCNQPMCPTRTAIHAMLPEGPDSSYTVGPSQAVNSEARRPRQTSMPGPPPRSKHFENSVRY